MVIATGGEPGEMQLAQLPSLQRAVALAEEGQLPAPCLASCCAGAQGRQILCFSPYVFTAAKDIKAH